MGMPSNVAASCDINIRVRYAESDPMGYLHHSRYFEYFEMGRTELLRQAGFRYRDLEARGVLFAVVKLECRFKASARYDDELVLTTGIMRMTRARIDHSYVLRRGAVVLCEASSTLACIDRSGRLMPIPDELLGEAEA
jgi:acyl-CoA thioester hydrolase